MTLLIKGGHVINPATEMDDVADILIEEGKVVEIGKDLAPKAVDRTISASENSEKVAGGSGLRQ